MRPLKIGITCYPSVGGSGIIATELGKLLAEKGHQVHFITSSIPFRLNTYHPNIHFHEVEVNQYAVFKYPPYDLTLASKIAEVAARKILISFTRIMRCRMRYALISPSRCSSVTSAS